MPGLLTKLLPHDATFFDMFADLGEKVHSAAQALVEMLADYSNPQASAEKIKDLEHEADTITHNLMMKLNQTFITPFDREDIHDLASRIDDVLDLIDAAATRLVIYAVDRIRPGVVDLARNLEQAAEQMVLALQKIRKNHGVLDRCIEINRLENEADRMCRRLIADLFENERDPVQIIKWKEIIEVLEHATDKCEDVANVIETVTLKNA